MKDYGTVFCYSFADRVRRKFVKKQKFANGNTAVQRTTPVGLTYYLKLQTILITLKMIVLFHETNKKLRENQYLFTPLEIKQRK